MSGGLEVELCLPTLGVAFALARVLRYFHSIGPFAKSVGSLSTWQGHHVVDITL